MKISASILDAKNRVLAVQKLNNTDVSSIHIDVMDGKMVDNIQFQDKSEIQKISEVSIKPLQIHLMVEDVLFFVEQFIELDVEMIIFHLETSQDILKIIDKIHSAGIGVGIAICPDTDMRKVVPYLDKIEMVLFMSVVPGKGGQTFIFETIDKINWLKNYIDEKKLSIMIGVDGGINDQTISYVQRADVAISGSYIIHSNNYQQSIYQLLK